MKKVRSSVLLLLGVFNSYTWAAEEKSDYRSADWGIAATVRTASIPYATDDNTVSTFLPLLYYKNDYVMLDGTAAALRLFKHGETEVNVLSRMRFVDIPKQIQNEFGGDTADVGVQLRYNIDDRWWVASEFMWDNRSRMHSNLSVSGEIDSGRFEFYPSMSLRYKSADFNQYYFAGDISELGSGIEAKVGIDTRYHVYSNLYLLGGAHVTSFDSATRGSPLIDADYQTELFMGFGFFKDKNKPASSLRHQPYFRVAHGWATPSNIGEILVGDTESDPNNNQLSSLFYGLPIADNLFGFPLEIYLTPGAVWHHKNTDQATGAEYVLAIKAYKTFYWPVTWRVGFAEGLSYVNKITQLEREEMEKKGYKPSKLLNYLDMSIDVNVGSILNKSDLNPLWLGYSLHHRSAIFESASQFGRIKGGSNYNTVYLQWHF
ncbi:MipA/OmpV family protein [Thaumasiovibrio sp. DFM-14]|uniref:MipA/OmpV family protein n=1 Tax=Thaumasiovibrio sp. DFM-14 TaxID=3384792 RepID=UPI0039A388A6